MPPTAITTSDELPKSAGKDSESRRWPEEQGRNKAEEITSPCAETERNRDAARIALQRARRCAEEKKCNQRKPLCRRVIGNSMGNKRRRPNGLRLLAAYRDERSIAWSKPRKLGLDPKRKRQQAKQKAQPKAPAPCGRETGSHTMILSRGHFGAGSAIGWRCGMATGPGSAASLSAALPALSPPSSALWPQPPGRQPGIHSGRSGWDG